MKAIQSKAPRMPVGMRVTPQMREQLRAAARASGRSLTQEIELRLEIAALAMERRLPLPGRRAAAGPRSAR